MQISTAKNLPVSDVFLDHLPALLVGVGLHCWKLVYPSAIFKFHRDFRGTD